MPSNGTYQLVVRDTQGKAGPDHRYQLRIGEPAPDFELRAVPSSLTLRTGTSAALTVYAIRRDGFVGDIRLELVDPPKGFVLSGDVIPGGADQVRITLTAPTAPTQQPVAIRIQGRGMIHGKERVRPAHPAEDMMQAFAYHHLVPQESLVAAVIGRTNRGLGVKSPQGLLKLVPGRTMKLRMPIPTSTVADRLLLTLEEPPEGIRLQGVTRDGDNLVLTLAADAKVKPGLRGNLIFRASLKTQPNPRPNATPRTAPRPVPAGTLPAIPFEIVGS